MYCFGFNLKKKSCRKSKYLQSTVNTVKLQVLICVSNFCQKVTVCKDKKSLSKACMCFKTRLASNRNYTVFDGIIDVYIIDTVEGLDFSPIELQIKKPKYIMAKLFGTSAFSFAFIPLAIWLYTQ